VLLPRICELLQENGLIENPWNKTIAYSGFVQLEVYLNGVPLRYTPKRSRKRRPDLRPTGEEKICIFKAQNILGFV